MEPLHEAAASDFVSQWGLRFDPFAPDAEIPFFAGEGFTATLDQLEHHSRYGNLLLVVTGPSGVGKTVLRKELVRRMGEEAEICALLAHPLHTTAQVLHQVAQAFGLGDDLLGGQEDELEAFCQRLAGAARGATRLLIIDDADTLDAGVVGALVNLAHRLREDAEPALKIVLFGEPHLSAMLAQSGISAGRGEDVHIIPLPPLAPEETGDYLQHRLAQAGFDKELPLSTSQLEALHKAGHGLPAQINRQAGHFLSELLDIASAIEEEPVTLTPALKRSLMVAGGIVVAGFLLLQLPKLFRADEAPRPAGMPVVVEATPASTSAAAEPTPLGTTPALDAAESEPVITTAEPAPDTVAGPLSATQDETVTPLPESGPEVALPAPTDTPPSAVPPSEALASTPVETAPAVEPEPAPVAVQPEPQPAREPVRHETASAVSLPRSEEGLKQANPKHYTVQLLGVSEEAKLAAFIRQHRLSGDLRTYRTQRAGQPFYILVQGVYPSRSAAQSAAGRLTGLPDKPWVKSIAAVHKDLGTR